MELTTREERSDGVLVGYLIRGWYGGHSVCCLDCAPYFENVTGSDLLARVYEVNLRPNPYHVRRYRRRGAPGYRQPRELGMSLLTRGNRKLGRNVWHWDLPAGPSCPGLSDICREICYAQKGFFVFQVAKYAANFALAKQPFAFLSAMNLELSRLPNGAVVRIHTSGDFFSVSYVDSWSLLAQANPTIAFYAYTRSWNVDAELREALEAFGQLPNVTIWASHDSSMPGVPAGWRMATIVGDWIEAPAMAHCPEQTGRRASCSDCGLCWHAKPLARLAFKLH